jgi:hypothetical protein
MISGLEVVRASWYLLDSHGRQLAGLPFIQGLPVGALDRV